ncbi:MAG: hypothetical protein QJR14_02950 [Bacillota bacterium]|nr:hypothetical protein [Bacillota bacterium]
MKSTPDGLVAEQPWQLAGAVLPAGVHPSAAVEQRVREASNRTDELARSPGVTREEALYLIGWLDGVPWLVGEAGKATLALQQHPLVRAIDVGLDPEPVGLKEVLAAVVAARPAS